MISLQYHDDIHKKNQQKSVNYIINIVNKYRLMLTDLVIIFLKRQLITNDNSTATLTYKSD